MYCLPKKSAAAAIVLLATATLVACSDSSSSLDTSPSFGSNAEAASSASETTTTEETTTTTTSTAPETIPEMGTETVAYNDFETESFTLDESTIVYISVENPSDPLFDVWLLDELELEAYQDAVDNLPASSASDHQNYLADYGLDLSGTIFEGIYLSYDLSAGDYYILIDNTDLGDNQPEIDAEVDYQFVVFAEEDLLIISEDEE